MWLLLLLTAVPAAVPVSLAQDSAGQPRKERPKDERVFYKGQIHVSRMSVYKEGEKVHLKMRVTYSTDLLNRGERLFVSPQIQNGTNRTTFAPMVFDGKSRKWRIRNENVIVVADEAYGQYVFDIEFVGTYHEWMRGCSLCFISEEVTGKNIRSHFTDCLYDDLRIEEYVDGEPLMVLRPTPADTSRPDSLPGLLPAPIVSDAARQERDSVLMQMVRGRNGAVQAADTVRPAVSTAPARPSEPVVSARERSTGNDGGYMFGAPLHLRTNLLYDAVLLPNIGIEYGISPRLSVVLNAGGNWLRIDRSRFYWRALTADAELRFWLGSRKNDNSLQHKGHHIGVYAAVYRYDIEFGGEGQMGDFNYGGGLSYGYSVPIGRRLSIDLSLGIGYMGGKYKKYEPRDDGRYYWLSDNTRSWIGPTKAEVTLVWHIGN